MKERLIKSGTYRRLQGHEKISGKAQCTCGRKMYSNSKFSGGWACKKELELARKLK